MASKPKAESPKKKKATVSLSAPELYRLDILANHWTLERGRKFTRSAVLSELIRPHLKSIVVSIRSGPVGEGETAA